MPTNPTAAELIAWVEIRYHLHDESTSYHTTLGHEDKQFLNRVLSRLAALSESEGELVEIAEQLHRRSRHKYFCDKRSDCGATCICGLDELEADFAAWKERRETQPQ